MMTFKLNDVVEHVRLGFNFLGCAGAGLWQGIGRSGLSLTGRVF